MSLAVVIIASEKRRETTFIRCLESVIAQQPDEIVVVADFPVGAKGVRSLVVPPMTRTTVDALVKRDVGWIATQSDSICYLCDDHRLDENFVQAFKEYEKADWGVLVPSRLCYHNGTPVQLNVGQKEGYAGGHCAIYRRVCGFLQPWSATSHHPNWDVIHTMQLKKLGVLVGYASLGLAVEDLVSEDKPWEMTADQQARHDAWHASIQWKTL
jgi:hypothetical protein